MQKPFLTILLLAFSLSLIAQPVNNRSTLTIEQIMQGEAFVGHLPEGIHWSEDGRTIYFSWQRGQDSLRSPYKVAITGDRTPLPLTLEEQKALPEDGDYNADRTLKAYEKNGDLFLLELATGKVSQITNTVGQERNPRFSGD